MFTANQTRKLVVIIAIESYGLQFIMLHPGEPWWHALVIGTVAFAATVGIGALAHWIAKP